MTHFPAPSRPLGPACARLAPPDLAVADPDFVLVASEGAAQSSASSITTAIPSWPTALGLGGSPSLATGPAPN